MGIFVLIFSHYLTFYQFLQVPKDQETTGKRNSVFAVKVSPLLILSHLFPAFAATLKPCCSQNNGVSF
jgi:hypothetical protein